MMRLDGIRHLHLLGIAGSGMASLAGLLQSAGFRVTGSDQGIYPPSSVLLEELGLKPREGFSPEHLDPPPDLVIVGNAIMRGNPELEEVLDRDLPCLSMPEALRWLALQGRRRVVVAGTHGKTTVTTVLAWVLQRAGRDPGWLIGGTPLGLDRPFALGRQDSDSPFVIEGDEYDTSFFDKGPKFLHYRPHVLVLNNVEYDHADIYPDPETYRAAFRRLCLLPPRTGRILVGVESPDAVAAAESALCPVESFGLGEEGDWGARAVSGGPEGVRFTLLHAGREIRELRFPMTGDYAVRNALAGWAAARALGVDEEPLAEALATFPGVRRRMEVRGEPGGVLVVDDFAHHPTAVREVVGGARLRWPERRLWAVFEPRSWSCRLPTHQEAFPAAFAEAQRVLLAPVPVRKGPPPGSSGKARDEPGVLDTSRIAADLAERGVEARACGGVDQILDILLAEARSGDVVLVLSNGSFDGLHQRLLDGLEDRAAGLPGTEGEEEAS